VHAHPDMVAADELRESRREANMLGTEGTGWDTAYAVRWLSSPEARWVTGVILPIDGGLASMIVVNTPKLVK
jgi:NAD(P)-dependent dehydrogenase (short-subunit alcohol dehydrogenase family)